MRELVRPKKDPKGRKAWGLLHNHCWACGISRTATFRKRFPSDLQTHHIVKPCRSDELCNYARLCSRCHDIVEGHRVPHPKGGYWPKITLENVLWLKQRFDPENYDPERLAALWGRATMPKPEALERLVC